MFESKPPDVARLLLVLLARALLSSEGGCSMDNRVLVLLSVFCVHLGCAGEAIKSASSSFNASYLSSTASRPTGDPGVQSWVTAKAASI